MEWSKIDGASSKPKRLHLEKDERNTLYHCPIQVCDHEGFQSQRGCRKHVSTKHCWFYYFDEKPDLSSFKDTLEVPVNKFPLTTTDDCTSSQTARTLPAFSVFGQIGQEFTQWLTGSGGGYKKQRAAQQIVRRSFKFLKYLLQRRRGVELGNSGLQPVFSESSVQVRRPLTRQMHARARRALGLHRCDF